MFYKRFRRFLKILYFSVTIKTIDTSHEEPPGVARRAAIVGLKNWNKRSTFALEFFGAFVALGTDVLAWDFLLRSAGCPDWGVSPCSLFMKGKPGFNNNNNFISMFPFLSMVWLIKS